MQGCFDHHISTDTPRFVNSKDLTMRQEGLLKSRAPSDRGEKGGSL